MSRILIMEYSLILVLVELVIRLINQEQIFLIFKDKHLQVKVKQRGIYLGL